MTDTEKVGSFCGFIVLLILGFAIYYSISYSQRFDRWNNRCIRQGGFIQLVSSSRYECFINGTQVTISTE